MYYFNGTGTVPNNSEVLVTRKVSAPRIFTFQIEAVKAGTNILNEVFASDGGMLDFAAWNNIAVGGTNYPVYLPVTLKAYTAP
jgi:hypothetical protein